MLPNQVLSDIPIVGTLLLPDKEPAPWVSRELGGIQLQDGTQGMQVKVWTATYDGASVWVTASGSPNTKLFDALDVTEISLSFDQNMNSFVTFVQLGVAKYYWYDTTVAEFVISTLEGTCISPRACLDDHREMESSTSDIILSYIRDGSLIFRAQRDRYTIQYVLYVDLNLTLTAPTIVSVGMNNVGRLQYHLQGNFFG